MEYNCATIFYSFTKFNFSLIIWLKLHKFIPRMKDKKTFSNLIESLGELSGEWKKSQLMP